MSDKIKSSSNVELNITLKITESEARALQEFTVFGTEVFLKTFYEKLGKAEIFLIEKLK